MEHEINTLLTDGREEIDTSYEMAKDALRIEGNFTEKADYETEKMYDTVKGELEKAEQKLAKGYAELTQGAEKPEDLDDAVHHFESAGQSIVNAAAGMTYFFNKVEGAIYNGDESWERDVSSIPVTMPEGAQKLESAKKANSKGMRSYDEALQTLTGELAEKYREDFGVMSHFDFGLGQQNPDIDLS